MGSKGTGGRERKRGKLDFALVVNLGFLETFVLDLAAGMGQTDRQTESFSIFHHSITQTL